MATYHLFGRAYTNVRRRSPRLSRASLQPLIDYCSHRCLNSIRLHQGWATRCVDGYTILVTTGLRRTESLTLSQGWGIAGYVFWSLMVFGSGRPLRDRCYRCGFADLWSRRACADSAHSYSAFIFSHIGLFCISMIALSFHRPQVAAYLVAGCVIYMYAASANGKFCLPGLTDEFGAPQLALAASTASFALDRPSTTPSSDRWGEARVLPRPWKSSRATRFGFGSGRR